MQMRGLTGAIGRQLRVAVPACCAVAVALSPTAARAQSLGDKYWVEVSAYWPDVDSKAQVASTNHPDIATSIDLESDLHLSDRAVLPAVNAGVQLGRFVLGADFYSLHRSASRMASRDINFDDVTYPVGAAIDTRFDSDIYRLTIGYDLIQRKNAELGVAIGGHVTDFKIELTGRGAIEGTTVIASHSRRKSVLAPLPTIGAFGAVEVAPRLTLGGRVDWLQLSVGDYDGRLWNAHAELSYRVHRNIALGVMYRYVDYRLDIHKPDWTGRMTYRFKGPALVVRAGFP